MELETIPYRHEHGLAIEPQEAGLAKHPDYKKWLRIHELAGSAYTFMVDGTIIACGGIHIFWQGCGEAWGLFGNDVEDHRTFVFKSFKDKLEYEIRHCGLRWVQIIVPEDFPEAIRFAQHLGFERKCTMRGYLYNGATAYLYAIERNGT